MSSLFKKLNFKNQRLVVCLNAPNSFHSALRELPTEVEVVLNQQPEFGRPIDFAIVFVTRLVEIAEAVGYLDELSPDDVTLWFCYPKQSSKKYTCSFNRDSGWQALGERGFEPVRQVAIDEDWSALRFRRTSFIARLTRKVDFAMSEEGKRRTTGK